MPIEKLGLPFLNRYSQPQAEELGALFREIQEGWSSGLPAGLRNQQACRYLNFTDYPIKEIAKLCGYYEEYHFSKMFKQMNGVPPSAYRSMQRQPTSRKSLAPSND
ncbi:helix-turn-helix domain-containing protein [Paenibacillus puerhi]|uniref:helix-turn-helix domain-containing protein n=1 Tax=Paenibacillus puerhi TaxID=2692622 RepID=UPI00135843D4|nr:AraC family transcriptional regulator [Paenibacillus puerhi]